MPPDGDREPRRAGLDRAPGAERNAGLARLAIAMEAVSVPCANSPPPKPIRVTPRANTRAEPSGAAKIDSRERGDAQQRADGRDPVRVRAPVEPARGEREADQRRPLPAPR